MVSLTVVFAVAAGFAGSVAAGAAAALAANPGEPARLQSIGGGPPANT